MAGYFYPADPEGLRREVDQLTRRSTAPVRTRAVIVPHGSYRQCGGVSGSTLARVVIPRRCMILGPSHTGSWMPWSLMGQGSYRTPLGDVPVDADCADALRTRCPFLELDAWAQRGEHAIEVPLPLLQRLGPADLTIVPLIVGCEDPERLAHVAQAIAQVVRMQEEPVLLMASSDCSHYQPQDVARAQDRTLLEAIQALDGPTLLRRGQDRSVLMCGAAAVACVVEAAKQLGASRAEVVAYGTSAQAGGDPQSVIGYAGVVIT